MCCTASPVLELRLKEECKLCSAEAACKWLPLQAQALACHQRVAMCYHTSIYTCAGMLRVLSYSTGHMCRHAVSGQSDVMACCHDQYDLINTCAGMLHVVPCTHNTCAGMQVNQSIYISRL